MKSTIPAKPEKFGEVLGIAMGGVPVYSSDYDSVDRRKYPARRHFRNYMDGIFMGYKWQCVEFARRWLYLNKGYVFDDIAMAYDIFQLDCVRTVADNRALPLHSFRNGAKRHPEPGCLLIWNEGGEFERTGHVAIITEVDDAYVRIAEQNVSNEKWPAGQNHARQLRSKIDDTGGYWIESQLPGASILGWVVQTDDNTHAEQHPKPDQQLFNLQLREVPQQGQAEGRWLNIANQDEQAYVDAEGGHKLSENDYEFFCISETGFREIKRATNELHQMFLHATEFVLKDDSLLERFCMPRALWPRLHRSWDNRKNQMITGRLDFSFSEAGLKVYEYNADSASCYMECGKVQKKWAEHFGCRNGECSGDHLFERLVDAWQASDAKEIIHILQDHDKEESYHALFMRSAMESAGFSTRLIKGMEGLSWDAAGHVVDPSGNRVRNVWKTWAWETALDQIRDEIDGEQATPSKELPLGRKHAAKHPRLVDVLLTDDVLVYEPLWTLIPSNKAILPVLWSLYPGHPYLLNSQFEMTDELQRMGYVKKPIVGRCGENISIFDRNQSLVKQTDGKFDDRDMIYQQFFPLPRIGGRNVQVSGFTAEGSFAGACVRVDRSLVVTSASDLPAMRVVEDQELLQHQAHQPGQ